MKKFILFYANADCSSYDSFVFDAKSLNFAFAFAKRWCKNSSKTFLGVADHCFISKYTFL